MKKALCVLVNWNGWDNTEKTIIQLSKQEKITFDVVIVENGSSDDSRKKIEDFEVPKTNPSAIHKLYKIYSDENLGFAGGVNFALRELGEHGYSFYWLLNNDASPAPRCLYELINTATENNLDFCSSVIIDASNPEFLESYGIGRHYPFTGKSKLTGKGLSINSSPLNINLNNPGFYLSGASLLVNSKAISTTGYMREDFFMYAEEKDWQFRAKKNGSLIGVSQSSFVLHVRSASFKKDRSLYFYYITRANVMFERIHYGAIAGITSCIILSVSSAVSSRTWREYLMSLKGLYHGLTGVTGKYNHA